METIVVVVVALWALRRLLVDTAYAVRGVTPAQRAGRTGRYGARAYFGEVWSDAWQSAGTRRQARRQRWAAGQPRWPRLAAARARVQAAAGRGRAWWAGAGGGRQWSRRGETTTDQFRETAFDRAWERVDARRAARTARLAAGGPRWPRLAAARAAAGRLAARLGRRTGFRGDTPPPTRTAEPHRAAFPVTTLTVTEYTRPAPRPPASPDRPAPAGAAGPVNGHHGPDDNEARRPPRPTDTHTEGTNMAEITGLGTATAFAGSAEQANTGAAGEWEQAIASMQAGGVSGPAVEAAHRAMEAQQQAAAAAGEARAAFERHQQVGEAYGANPDAGTREFVTSE